MPDIKQLNDETMDRLASLSEQINTSKGFGMMGMLANEQQQQVQQPAPEAPAAVTAQEPDSAQLAQILEPLNSSLRQTSETFSREIGSLRSELSSLARQPVQAPAAQDLDADPATARLSQIERELMQTKLNTAWERARNSLNAAKGRYGADFDYSEQDLQSVWKQHIGNNVQAAESTNWDVYMQQQYDSRRAPKLEARLKSLEADLAKAKAPTTDPTAAVGGLPRANRNGAPPAAAGGIANDFDEDVYRRASQRMGKRIGSFAGFNRLLVDEQNKKLLRTAS